MYLVAFAVDAGLDAAADVVVVAAVVVCAFADIVAQLLSVSLGLASVQWSWCLAVVATKAIQPVWV